MKPELIWHVECEWKPEREKLVEALEKVDEVLEHGGWNWNYKATLEGEHACWFFAITLGSAVQGMMAISRNLRPARTARGRKVVYVEYVESAPWNHRRWKSRPYAGLGTRFMAEAIHTSKQLGCEGRIGLHALPSAESFYREMEMTEYPKEGRENLVYFELTPDCADAWLKEVKLWHA